VLEWSVLVTLARRWKDGTIAVAMVLCFLAASAVLLHAHSLKLTNIALFFGAALAGPALVTWFWPGDTGPVFAAVAVVLPGLILTGLHDTTDHKVPLESFLLAGLAPLALTPMLLPFLIRQPGWKHWLPGIILPLVPAALSVILAAEAEPLDFNDSLEDRAGLAALPWTARELFQEPVAAGFSLRFPRTLKGAATRCGRF
jgi:hypothetical protein